MRWTGRFSSQLCDSRDRVALGELALHLGGIDRAPTRRAAEDDRALVEQRTALGWALFAVPGPLQQPLRVPSSALPWCHDDDDGTARGRTTGRHGDTGSPGGGSGRPRRIHDRAWVAVPRDL